MQYIKTQTILFLYGLVDSLQFMKGLKHYTFDKGETYCKQISQYLKSAMQFAGQKLLIIFAIDIVVYLLSLLSIPKFLLSISWLLALLLFIENNVRQLIYVGKISQTAISYEINVRQSRQFLIYNLTRDTSTGLSTILDQFKLTMQALLFSFLLLLQTSVLDILVLILPDSTFITTIIKHIDFLLYAVYITVGYVSLKIPYQDHLPYYLHIYIGYLMGYSAILSYMLNIYFSFPKLGLVFTILSPICMLRCFQIDAPLITEIESRSFKENLDILMKDFLGDDGLPRTSYESHLKLAENDKTYKSKSRRTIGWFTLAKGVRPYVITPLNNAIVLCLKIYNSLIGAA